MQNEDETSPSISRHGQLVKMLIILEPHDVLCPNFDYLYILTLFKAGTKLYREHRPPPPQSPHLTTSRAHYGQLIVMYVVFFFSILYGLYQTFVPSNSFRPQNQNVGNKLIFIELRVCETGGFLLAFKAPPEICSRRYFHICDTFFYYIKACHFM